jgi:heme/copper-type cytochrome/quinol oxidase subunit 2
VLASIEFDLLLETVYISIIAGVVVTGLFAMVVRESARSAEERRAGASGASALHATLAVLFFVAFAVIVVFGLVIMLRK